MVSTNGNGRPAWFQEWAAKYGAEIATAFILHFNTADYVQVRVDEDEKALSLRNFLSAAFGKKDIIAIYNRAEGITFPYRTASAMRKRFIDEMGLGAQLDETEKALWEARNPGKKPEEAALPTSPRECLQLLEQLLKRTESTVDVDEETGQGQPLKSVVIVEGAELVVPNADIAAMSPDDRTVLAILQRWGRDEEIADAGNPVILITQNLTDIHESLRAASSRYEAIAIPIPTEEERLSFVEYLLAKTDSRTGEKWAPVGILGEIAPAQLARMTAGLNRLHVEDLFLRALEEGGVLTEEMVKDRKFAIISSEFDEVIEVMEPKFGFEALGGLEQVKSFFRRNVIGPLKTGNRRRVPQGVLLVGPPGTGKSFCAQAVAKESGLNCINLNLAKILGQYVGSSERNLDRALQAIRGLTPVIVFIDELDQAFQRGSSGDSGVSNRLFGRLMQFMADTSNRGRVVWLAASVTGDTPVLVKTGRNIRLTGIGKLVDAYFDGDEEGEVACQDMEVLTVRSDNSAGWGSVASLYRHRVESVYDIGYAGEWLSATGDHSVFVVDDQGLIAERRVADLKPGDLLVTPLKASGMAAEAITLDMVDSVSRQAEDWKQAITNAAKTAPQRIVAQQFGVSQSSVSYYVNEVYDPRKLRGEKPKSNVILDEELAWLFGLFVAEGYARKEMDITLSAREAEMAERAGRIAEERFGLKAKHRISNGAHHVIINSAPLGRWLQEHVGADSYSMRVPSFIWQATAEIALSFIKGWVDGDGHITKRGQVELTTVSQQLAYELVWLLRLHGITARVGTQHTPERRIGNGKPIPATVSFRVHIPASENPWTSRMQTMGSGSHDKRVPIRLLRNVYDRLRPACTRELSAEYGGLRQPYDLLSRERAQRVMKAIYENRRQDDPVFDRIAPFVFGDLGVVQIDEIRHGEYDGFVYDLCGCEGERFIGGRLPVLLHNSNRPDMIDAALKRPGRFDKIVAFLVPNEGERGQIILANLKRSSIPFSIVADDPRWEGLLQRTDNWTGAELEGLVVKAWEIAEDASREVVGVGDLVDAVDRLRPSTADIEWMTELALREVNDRDLLPAAYSNRLDNRKQIEEKIRELAPRGKRGREI